MLNSKRSKIGMAKSVYEPTQKKRDLMFCFFFSRFLVLQKNACTVPNVGYRHVFLPEAFSSSLLHVCKLARLCLCAGSSEPLLVAFVISTLFSCA